MAGPLVAPPVPSRLPGCGEQRLAEVASEGWGGGRPAAAGQDSGSGR
jgi:hypothetical protein